MILGEDFKFRDDMKQDTVPIELMLDPYKGVIYRYTKVGIKENDNETATLQFDYELYERGNHTETKLRKDKRFTGTLGLILNTIILEVDEDEHRKNNTQKSNQE